MNVIVREGEKTKIIVKGSPEKIEELSRKDSLPENFKEILSKFTF